ncbi:hypothetical protein T05_9320, partial [Trichinella murrelli]
MNNEEKEKGKHRRFVKQADHGRHETDHRRHEAEQGKTKELETPSLRQRRVQTLPCCLSKKSARSSSLERGKPRLSALKRRIPSLPP